ncbi:hypothetical protein A4X16_16835 [Microbacterium sp. H83]|nr:hypothetical protein A4X16_16835 [Microbacterium sp. H83]
MIRVLDAGEGPYSGTLVTDGGAVVVLTDAAAISGWAGWQHAGDEHVAGPLDLVRRRDGHDVLLPWCTEPLSLFLGRRLADGPRLSAGEVSTLVGSILRGLDELARGQGDGVVEGDWWLTDDGRPLFAIGRGGIARERSARVVDRLHGGCDDRTLGRLLATIREGLMAADTRPGMPRRQLELWESELFAIAAPRPLDRETHGPARVRDIEMVRNLRTGSLESRRTHRAAAGTTDRAARGVLPDVVAAAARRTRELRRSFGQRWRTLLSSAGRADSAGQGGATPDASRPAADRASAAGAPSRRRRLVVAGAAAVVVLYAGLLWPGDATGESADGAGAPVSAPTPAPTSSRQAGGREESGAEEEASDAEVGSRGPTADAEKVSSSDDPVVATHALLSTIGACATAGDTECAGAVADGSTGVVDTVAAFSDAVGPEAPSLALVDEYGDVAVIRATSGAAGAEVSGAAQMLVVIRVADEWLVRDAYDVADQPE